ncbi:hypothetical protein [Nocardia sp. NPDC051832]|uniref:hypothetical protein n=1 Tax=Nocardia sp. NPDC051832 TaxID=3155673 RepID=UPI00342A4325
MTVLQISRRFNGPPGSGNGGYVAGLLAERHPAAIVTVLLRNKPPLETPLHLRDGNLLDGTTLIAESRAGAFERDVPQAVSFGTAEAASSSYQSNDIFAGCFVCGSGRSDGLRIEAGGVGPGLVAAPWIPDATLPIGSALLWAAMDCPGGWSLDGMFERPALLGSMTATVFDLPAVGEKCVVVGQNHGDQRRKSFAATAVYGSDDRLLGRAEQIWIRLS